MQKTSPKGSLRNLRDSLRFAPFGITLIRVFEMTSRSHLKNDFALPLLPKGWLRQTRPPSGGLLRVNK